MKVGKLIIPENEKRLHVNYTDYVVYSYDRDNFVFRFAFENYPEINGEAYLILKADDLPTQQFTLTIENKRAEWIVPERLLGYEGHVKGYLYLTENDLIKSEDAYMYTFLMRRSQIDEGVLEIESMYFEKFEDLVAKMNLRFDELSASASNVFNDYKSFADKKKEDIANVDLDISSDVDEVYNSLLEFYLKSKNLMTEEVKRVADKKVLVYIEMENLLKSTEKSVETMLYDIQNKLTDIDLAKDSAMTEIERYINQIKEIIKQAEEVLGGIISGKIYTKNEVDTILLDKASVKRVDDLEDTQERNFTDIKLELSTGLKNKADKNAFEILDSEVMDARKPFGEEAFPNLGKRLDDQIGLNSDFREFEANESFMTRLKNEMEERSVNVKWFGAKGDNISDDTIAFNDAISFALLKKKTVYVPNGIYLIDYLKLDSYTSIIGQSSDRAIIKRIATSIAPVFIGLSSTDITNVTLRNLKIEGNQSENKNACDGINFDNTGISRDSFHLLCDLKLESFTGSGIVVGKNARECRVLNITTSNNGVDGIFFDSTDTFVTNVSAFWNKRNGVSLGSNSSMTKILNVKAFGNDFNGFNLQGSKGNQLLNCESQDNGRCGLRISDYANNNKISAVIDSNGAIESATSAVSLSDAYNNQLSLIASTRVNYSSKYNDSLIDFLRSSYNDVDIQTQFVSSKQLLPFKNYPLITNSLKINGGDYSMFNLIEDSEFISDKKINGVSDIFDNVEVNSGVTSTYGVDRAGRTQNIDILTNTGATVGSSGTHFLKRIIRENFSVFSLGCDLYNDNQDADFVFYLDFMDSSYSRISTHSETAALKYQFDSKIPVDAKYINIKLTYFAKKAGIRANGKISNLKIGFY